MRWIVVGILLLGASLGQDDASAPSQPIVGRSLSDLLQNTPELQAFRVALHASPLAERLDRSGSYTLFAPVNTAFSYLSHGELDALLEAPVEERLAGYLVEGVFTPDTLRAMLRASGGALSLPTLAGGRIGFALDPDGAVVVGGVARTGAWFAAANGVVVLIENVLPGQ